MDDKVCGLESSLQQSNDIITQLRHEVTLKTDLLHAFTVIEIEAAEESEEDEAAAAGLVGTTGIILSSRATEGLGGKRRKLTAANVELMQRKVKHLVEDNKKLQEEATEVNDRVLL